MNEKEKKAQRALGLLHTWAISSLNRTRDPFWVDWYLQIEAISVEDAINKVVDQMPELAGYTLEVCRMRPSKFNNNKMVIDNWDTRVEIVARV